MSGWDVARHKMQRSEMAHIPVIITSGLSAEAIHSRGNDHPLAGAMLLLGKPIDLDRLDRALETIESAMEPVVPK